MDRETEELKHESVPLSMGKLIQQGRQAKGMSQKDLATVSWIFRFLLFNTYSTKISNIVYIKFNFNHSLNSNLMWSFNKLNNDFSANATNIIYILVIYENILVLKMCHN